MDVDAYEGGWEHIPDYSNRHANSNSSAGDSSNVLSASLQSYLNATDPSWAGGDGLASPPPRQQLRRRDPTAIYRAEIARIGRRFGLTKRASGKSPHRSSTSECKAAAGSPAVGSRRSRFGRDVRATDGGIAGRQRGGLGSRRSYQVEGFLEQGWDGRVALVGKRSGRGTERNAVIGSASRSNSSRIWDSPPPVRQTARSAGPTRSRSSGHTGILSPSANLWGVAEGPVNTQARSRRPSTAPAVQISPGGEHNRDRLRNDPFASGTDIVGRWPADSAEGRSSHLLPEISRSASPTPLSPHRRGDAKYSIFGSGGNRYSERPHHPRRRPDIVPVRALLLLSDWSIGHEVSAVSASPNDSVSYLRAVIQADIVRDMRGTIRKEGASAAIGHSPNGGDSGCPLFSFFYADGVAIDRGQEERLSVKDIAISSSSPVAGAATSCSDLRWEDEDSGEGGGSCNEMAVFLRASESGTEEVGAYGGSGGGGSGGVLHRWESLQAGAWGNEALWRSPASMGSSSSSIFLDPTSSSFDTAGGRGGQRAGGQGYDVPGVVGGAPLRNGSTSSSSLAEGAQQHTSRRFSVSFDESKAARRRMIQEQVILLAASKVTLITKVFRGYKARVLFQERLHLHRQASKIQLCVRQRAAKQELHRRVRRKEKAVRIQCLARSRRSRREAAIRRDRRLAATRIQGSARSKAAKKEAKARLDQRRREAAADTARKKKEEEEALAEAERTTREMAEARRKEEEDAAIARIQNFARTTVAKKEVTRRRAHKEATIVKNRNEAAMQIQCFTRVQAAKLEASERRKRKESANRIQLKARQRAAKKRTEERREAVRKVHQRREEEQRQAAIRIQAAAKGKRARARVRDIKNRRDNASVKITALARGRRSRRRAKKMRREKYAAIVIQKTARGRRGRTRSPPRAHRHRASKSEETAATSTQKVARGNSDRALFRHLKQDMEATGLYGNMPDERQSGKTARRCQQGSGASMQEEDGPRHVGFSTGVLSHEITEKIAANMALDLDESVRIFVALQATVRRAENMEQGASGGERDRKCILDGRMENDRDFPASAEPEQHSVSVSESDFLLTPSLSGSLEEEAQVPGQDQLRRSGFQPGYTSDGEKGPLETDAEAVRVGNNDKHEEDAGLPRSETEEGKNVFKSDFVLDDETVSGLGTPLASQSGDDVPHIEEPEATGSGTEEGQEAFKSGFALECESGSVLTESRGGDSHQMEDDEREGEVWKSDFAIEALESEGIEGGEEPSAGSVDAGDVSAGKRIPANGGSDLAGEEILMPVEGQQAESEAVFAPTSGAHSLKGGIDIRLTSPSSQTPAGVGLEGVDPGETCPETVRPKTDGQDEKVGLPDHLSTKSKNGTTDDEKDHEREGSTDDQDADQHSTSCEGGLMGADAAVGVQDAIGVEDAPEVARAKVDVVKSSACVVPANNEPRPQGADRLDVGGSSTGREMAVQAPGAEAGDEPTAALSLKAENQPAAATMGNSDVDTSLGSQESAGLGETALADDGVDTFEQPNEERTPVAMDPSSTVHTGDASEQAMDLDPHGSSDGGTVITAIDQPGSEPATDNASSETVHLQDSVSGGQDEMELQASRATTEVQSANVCPSDAGIETATSAVEIANADVAPADDQATDKADGVFANPESQLSVSPDGTVAAVAFGEDAVVASGDTTEDASYLQDTVASGEEGGRVAGDGSFRSKSAESYSPEAERNADPMTVGITTAVSPPLDPEANDAAKGADADAGLTSPAPFDQGSVAPQDTVSCFETDMRLQEKDVDPVVSTAGQRSPGLSDNTLAEPGLVRSAPPQENITEVVKDESFEEDKAQDVVAGAEDGVILQSFPAGVEGNSAEEHQLEGGTEAAPSAVKIHPLDAQSTAAGAADTAEGDPGNPGLLCSASSTEETTAVSIVNPAITIKDDAAEGVVSAQDVVASGEDDVGSTGFGMESGKVCSPEAGDKGVTIMVDNTNADAPPAGQSVAEKADGSTIESASSGPVSPTGETTAIGSQQPSVQTTDKSISDPANGQDITALGDSVEELQGAPEDIQDTDAAAEGQSAEACLSLAENRATHVAMGSTDANESTAGEEGVDGIDDARVVPGPGRSISPDTETPRVISDQPVTAPTGSDGNENVGKLLDGQVSTDEGEATEAGASVRELAEAPSSEAENKAATTTGGNANADEQLTGQESTETADGALVGSTAVNPAPPAEETTAVAIYQADETHTEGEVIEDGMEVQVVIAGAPKDMNTHGPGLDGADVPAEALSSPEEVKQADMAAVSFTNVAVLTGGREAADAGNGALADPGLGTGVPLVAVDDNGVASAVNATEEMLDIPDAVCSNDEDANLQPAGVSTGGESVEEETAALGIDQSTVMTTVGGSPDGVKVRQVAADSDGNERLGGAFDGIGTESRSGEDAFPQATKPDAPVATGEASADVANLGQEGADMVNDSLAGSVIHTSAPLGEEAVAAAIDQPVVTLRDSDVTEETINLHAPVQPQQQATGVVVDNSGVALTGDGSNSEGGHFQDDVTAHGRGEEVPAAGVDKEHESVDAPYPKANIESTPQATDADDLILPDHEPGASMPLEEGVAAGGNDQPDRSPTGKHATEEAVDLQYDVLGGVSDVEVPEAGVDVPEESAEVCCPEEEIEGTMTTEARNADVSIVEQEAAGMADSSLADPSLDTAVSLDEATITVVVDQPGVALISDKEHVHLPPVVMDAEGTPAEVSFQQAEPEAKPSEAGSSTRDDEPVEPEANNNVDDLFVLSYSPPNALGAESPQSTREELDKEETINVDTTNSLAVDEGAMRVTGGSTPPLGDKGADQTTPTAPAQADKEEIKTDFAETGLEQSVLVSANGGTEEHSVAPAFIEEDAVEVSSKGKPLADADAGEADGPAIATREGALSAVKSEQRTATIGDDSVIAKPPIFVAPEIGLQPYPPDTAHGEPEETQTSQLATFKVEAPAESATGSVVALGDAAPGICFPASVVEDDIPTAEEDSKSVATLEAVVPETVSEETNDGSFMQPIGIGASVAPSKDSPEAVSEQTAPRTGSAGVISVVVPDDEVKDKEEPAVNRSVSYINQVPEVADDLPIIITTDGTDSARAELEGPGNEKSASAVGDQDPSAVDNSLSATVVPPVRESNREGSAQISDQPVMMPDNALLKAEVDELVGVKPEGGTLRLDNVPPTSADALYIAKNEEQQDVVMAPDAVEVAAEDNVQYATNDIRLATPEIDSVDECVAIEAAGADDSIPAAATVVSALNAADVPASDATANDPQIKKVNTSVADNSLNGAVESQITSKDKDAATVETAAFGEVERFDSMKGEEEAGGVPTVLKMSGVSGLSETDVHSGESARVTTDLEALSAEPAGVSPDAIPDGKGGLPVSGIEIPQVEEADSVASPVFEDKTMENPPADVATRRVGDPTVLEADAVPLDAGKMAPGEVEQIPEAEEAEKKGSIVEHNDNDAAVEQLLPALAKQRLSRAAVTLVPEGELSEISSAFVPDKKSDTPLIDEEIPQALVKEGLSDTTLEGELAQVTEPTEDNPNIEIAPCGVQTPQQVVEDSVASNPQSGAAGVSSPDTSNEIQDGPVVDPAQGESSGVADTTPSIDEAREEDGDKAAIESHPVIAITETVVADGVGENNPLILKTEEDAVSQEVILVPTVNVPSDMDVQEMPDTAQAGHAAEMTQQPATTAADALVPASTACEEETPEETLPVVPGENLDVPIARVEVPQTEADNTLSGDVFSGEFTEVPPPPVPMGSLEKTVDDTAALAVERQQSDAATVDTEPLRAAIGDEGIVEEPPLVALPQPGPAVEEGVEALLRPEQNKEEEVAQETVEVAVENGALDAGEIPDPEKEGKVAPTPKDAHGPTVEHNGATVTDEMPSEVGGNTPEDGETNEQPTSSATNAVNEEKLDDPVTVVDVPQTKSDDIAANVEGETAEEAPLTVTDLNLDALDSGFEILQAVEDDKATIAVLEGEKNSLTPPPVPLGKQNEAIPLVAEDEPTELVDRAVVIAVPGDESGNEGIGEQPPVAAGPQIETASGVSEDSPPTPEQEEEVATQQVIDAPFGSTASDVGMDATPDVDQAGQTTMAFEGVLGANVEHPLAAGIDEVPSVVPEGTPQDVETAEEPPPAVHDKNIDNPGTFVQVPHPNSEDIVAPTEGEIAGGSPPAVLNRDLDVPASDIETQQAVVDDSVTTAASEGKTARIPLSAVPHAAQDKATLLLVEGESPGADKAVVTPVTEEKPGEEDVAEPPSQTKEVAGVSEDDLPISKQEQEAATLDVIHAPVAGIVSDTSVEATPEVEGKAVEVFEDVHGATAEQSVAATNDGVLPAVTKNTPQDGQTTEEPPPPVTDEKCDSPDTGMQGSQALSEEISATVEGETAEEPPPDERDRGLEACILDEVVSNVVADDSAFAAVVEEETTGVTLPMPDGIQNEAAPLVAEDESSSVADKAVATPATEHEPGGEDVTEQSSPFQEAAGVTENSQPIPKQEEAVAPDVIHTPGEGIESHASVEPSPGVEAKVATVSEGVHGATTDPPAVAATDGVPMVVQEKTPHDGESAEQPPPIMTEEKVDDPGTVVEVPQTGSGGILANAEGKRAEEPPPDVPDRGPDVYFPDPEITHTVADDSTSVPVVEGETSGAPSPAVSNGDQHEAALLVVEDESLSVVDKEAVTPAAEDEPGDKDAIEPSSQINGATGATEEGLPIPKQEDEGATPGGSHESVVGIESDSSVEATPEVEGKEAATFENAAVAQEDTSQHGEIAEEPPDAASEEKVDSTGTVMEAAQAISEDVAVTTEGETAEGSPPAVLDRGRDISILDAEMPHAAADDSVTAAVVEGDIPEVLLRAVAQETQDEATLLIAEGEPSGVVENEAVMVATEDQPANEGVSEQLPQIQETTRMSEDDLPIPKQEDESITPGVSDAPVADIASDTSVEAAPEVKGKAAAVSEQDVHDPAIEHPVAAATDEVPPVVRDNTPHEGGTAAEPLDAVTEEKIGGTATLVEVPQGVTKNVVATTEAETAEEPPLAVPDRSLNASVSGTDMPRPVTDDRAAAAVVDGEISGVPPPAAPHDTHSEASLLTVQDESSGVVDKAVVTAVATADKLGDEGGVEQEPIGVTHQTEAAAGSNEDGLTIPQQAEEMVEQDVVEAPVESVATDTGVEVPPEEEGKVKAVAEDVSGATIEHPVADTIDDVPSVIRENTTQDAENAEESPPAVTDEEPIDPFTDVQVPQAVSENITASTVGEAAEESPPAVPDRSVDVAVLDLGTPQAVADRSVNADGIEGEATGVPPPSVPNGTLDETPVLVVEDESTGVIDNAAVISSTGDEPQDEGIIEQQPIAAVSQAGEVTQEQENSPPTPKVGEEAITQEGVAAPADSSSALDTGVGAILEMDEADQTSVVPEDVNAPTVKYPVADATNEVPSEVQLPVPDGETAEVPQASSHAGDFVDPGSGVETPVGEQDGTDSAAKGTTVGAEHTAAGTVDEKGNAQDSPAGAVASNVAAAAPDSVTPAVTMEQAEEGSHDPSAPSGEREELKDSSARPENSSLTKNETCLDEQNQSEGGHTLSGDERSPGNDNTPSNESLPDEISGVGETADNATSLIDVTPEEPTADDERKGEEPGRDAAGSPDGDKPLTSVFPPENIVTEEPRFATAESA